MKKENIIVSVIIVASIIGYFIFITLNRKQAQDNVFLNRQKIEIDTLAPKEEIISTLRYKSRKFSFKDLPEDIQKRIKNEQLVSHIKITGILKDFIVRFHQAAKSKDGDVNSVDIKNLPKMSTITSARVGDKLIEEVYQKNIDKFKKGHDPIVIKQQIKVELLAQDAYEYIINLIGEIRKTTNSKLPASPKVPESWLITEGISPTFGESDATNHLIWIGYYGCPNCSNYSDELGKLIQKYTLKNIRVTFVPWTYNDIDTYAFLNLAAFCLREEIDEQTFWRFHSVAMSNSEKIFGMKPDDLKRAQTFLDKILESIEISASDIKKVNRCANDLSSQNKLLYKMSEAKRKLDFIPDLIKSPTIFLNGRILDLEGTTLFEAVDLELSQVEK